MDGSDDDVIAAARRALWSRSNRAVVVVGEGLRIVAFNAAFGPLVGYADVDVTGRSLLDLIPIASKALKATIDRVRESGNPVLGAQLRSDWGDVAIDVLPLRVGGVTLALLEASPQQQDVGDTPSGVDETRRVFTEMSRELASVSGPLAKEAIERALSAVCSAYDIDRAYVRLLSDDELSFVLRHEYHRPGLEPWRARVVGVTDVGWAYDRFRAGLPVVLTSLDELPPEAATFRATMERIGISTTVGVPVVHGPRFLGYLAYVTHTSRVWMGPVVGRLQLAAEMIAGVVARSIAEDELRDRLAFEETLSAAAARFVDLEPERVDAEIVRTLGNFGASRGLDRAVVLMLEPSASVLTVAYEWCAEGVASVKPIYASGSVDELSPPLRRALSGTLVSARAEDVRPGSDEEALLRIHGAHGFVMVPLRVGAGVRGVLMLQVLQHSRYDAELASSRSRLVADVVADALSRKAATEKLRRSRLRFQRIVESAIDGVVMVDASCVVLEWSPQAVEVFGRRREDALQRAFEGFVVEAERDALRRRLCAIARAGAAPAERFEIRAVRADGGEVPVEISATRLEMAEGIVVALFARDIADRKRAELERQRAFDEVSRLRQTAERERDYLRQEDGDRGARVIGTSPAIKAALSLVEAVAETDATVLLTGESGVGKECFARLVHTTSRRKSGPFVRVNCASIPATLFESEFFGHAKGSFTGAHKDRAGRFELADGGTLLLDEVGEIPLDQQAKLLRVLQEGEIERVGEERTRKLDVRVIAATNRDLAHDAATGRFRGDLYFRLGVFPVPVPPLRERGEDVVLLARYFLGSHAAAMRRPGLHFTPDDEARLRAYDWPGNVRELDHVIERAVILSRAAPLRLDLALPSAPPPASISGSVVPPPAELLREEDFRRIERENLLLALDRAHGRVSGPGGVAELLGMRPSTARDRMKALGINR